MRSLLVFCAFLLVPTLAQAAAGPHRYSFDDLIAQKVKVPLETPLAAETMVKIRVGSTCEKTVKVAQGAQTIELTPKDLGNCAAALWENPTAQVVKAEVQADAVVEVRPPEVASEPARTVSVEGVIAGREELPQNARLILLTGSASPKPWVAVPARNGTFDFVAQLGTNPKVGTTYFLDTGASISEGNLVASLPKTPADKSPQLTGDSFMTCTRGDLPRSTLVFCVDFLSAEGFPVVRSAGHKKAHVIRPNQDVVVKVRHAATAQVSIEMAGTRGLFPPGARNLTGAETVAHSGRGEQPQPVKASVTIQEFAPRQPGDADITVRISEEGKPNVVYPIELIVEQTYSGAVRIGIGFPFSGAQDAKYGVVTRSGSEQAEVAAEGFGVTDLELVVGYSVYLDRGGRSLVRGCHPFCLGPFFGIGVFAPEAQGSKFIKSAYLGFELELSPNFSASINAVARRVTRLQEGYQVGSAVDGSEAPVREGIGFGGGVVLTFSPDFLRLARPAATSFLE